MFLRYIIVLGSFLALCIGCGCAPTGPAAERELDGVAIEPVANPTAGPPVVIVKVTDMRQFTSDTSDPSVTSMDRPEQISDRAIRVQTIGRFFASEVVLPQGQSVETLVLDAVQNGLRAKGYTVVSNGAAGTPVEVEITKFWMWANGQAFGPAPCACDVEIKLKSPITLSGAAETVAGTYVIHPAMSLGIALAVIDDSLDDLSKNIQAKVKSP